MKTFQNVSKKELLKELNWHLKQDRIIQGKYGNIGGEFKGCHMGCVANSIARINGVDIGTSNHEKQAEYLYGDKSCEWFVQLCEVIFEGLSVNKSKRWVVDSFSVIPEGITPESLNSIEIPIKIFILEKTKGYHRNEEVYKATNMVIEALKGNGDIVVARAAARAAASYARAAADAAYVAADYAAHVVVRSAGYAAAAAYAGNSRSKFYEELAAFVIEQLKALDTDLKCGWPSQGIPADGDALS